MNLLILVHRWVGLALALVLLVLAATGVLLLAKGPYHRAAYPALAEPLTPDDVAGYGEVLSRIHARFPDARTVKLPQPGVNAFQVWRADDREAFVHAQTGVVIDEWHWSERVPAFVFELHAHLLGGTVGLWVNGLVACLTMLVLVLGGLVVWWPRRRAVSLTRLGWSRWTPGELVQSHTAVGVLSCVPILVFAATGLAIAWSSWVMPTLSAWLDAPRAEAPAPLPAMVPTTWPLPPARWQAILEAAQRAVPDGRLVFVMGGPEASGVTFRVRMPGEWHPNGRSLVVADPDAATIVRVVDARAQGLGTRLGYAMYPIHAARVGAGLSWLLVAGAVLAGAGLGWLGVTGVAAWWQRRRGRRVRVARRAVA